MNGDFGDGPSGNPILSADGRWLLFDSLATNLIMNVDSNGVRDVFLKSIASGTTTVLSTSMDGSQFSGHSKAIAMGPDGELAVFRSDSPSASLQSGISSDLWLRWRTSGMLKRVELAAVGATLPVEAHNVVLSRNGRGLVCRIIGLSNVIWLIDVDTGVPSVVSGDLEVNRPTGTSQGQQGQWNLLPPDAASLSITDDGSMVAFLAGPRGNTEVRAYLWSQADGLRGLPSMGAPKQLLGLELSPDGKVLAFLTAEAVPPAGVATPGAPRWYLRNLATGETRTLMPDVPLEFSLPSPVFSPGSESLLLQTAAVLPGIPDFNGAEDVLLAPVSLDSAQLISRRQQELANRSGGGGSALEPGTLSHDGRLIVFVSNADNLVDGDSNGRQDVIVRDLVAGTNMLVSVGLDGRSPNADSWRPRISADGRWVVFVSASTNLVSGDSNPISAVYVRDLARGTTVIASARDQDDIKGSRASLNPQISANGEWIAFESNSTNLVLGLTNNRTRLYLRHLPSRRTVAISGELRPSDVNESSFGAVMDASGNNVAFLSEQDAYLYSVPGGTQKKVTSGIRAETLSISRDGSRLALLGNISNHNSLRAVYWRDLATTTNRLIVAAPDPKQNRFANVSISGDGRRVVFDSNLVPSGIADTNGTKDVFCFDIASGVVSMVSTAATGERAGNAASDSPVISGDGGLVAFRSFAEDLVAGDTNRSSDIFVRNLATEESRLLSRREADGALGNGALRDRCSPRPATLWCSSPWHPT